VVANSPRTPASSPRRPPSSPRIPEIAAPVRPGRVPHRGRDRRAALLRAMPAAGRRRDFSRCLAPVAVLPATPFIAMTKCSRITQRLSTAAVKTGLLPPRLRAPPPRHSPRKPPGNTDRLNRTPRPKPAATWKTPVPCRHPIAGCYTRHPGREQSKRNG
jgi:hypothetical protein